VQKCKKKKCKWWCGCCNKWFCWIETIVVKVVKWVVVTVGKWVTRVVCEVVAVGATMVDFVVDAVGLLVGLVLAIPLLGRFIKGLWNLAVELFWRILGIPGLILDLIGLMWPKKLRICVVILREDMNVPVPPAMMAGIEAEIKKATAIFKDQANVKLIVEDIQAGRPSAPDRALDVSCGGGAAWDDVWLAGGYFEFISNQMCFDSAGRRIFGAAAPIVVFAVRTVEGTTAGCSLPWADYVTIERDNPICLAHEVAHACWLPHHSDRSNLLYETCGGTKLRTWQKLILRNSRHVTYF